MVLENEQQDNAKHACYTQDFIIKETLVRNIFYSMYVLSLPLQIVMICLIILEKMFVEEISLDSCASYILSNRHDPYYYCRLTSEPFSTQSISQESIINFCNSTVINDTYQGKIDDITCIQYYFDKTKIIICELLCMLLLTISVSIAFVSIVLLLYLQLGDQITKSAFTLDLIDAASITLINTLISM
jgi:hypothetical protein